MKKDTRLYNVIFPIWLLWLFPFSLAIILPLNFMIDSAVILIFLIAIKSDERREIYKKSILTLWGCGFFADCIGSLFLLTALHLETLITDEAAAAWYSENISMPLTFNPFDSIWCVLLALAVIAISGVLIYFLDSKFALKKTSLSERHRSRAALAFAIATMPYTFLIPTEWFI